MQELEALFNREVTKRLAAKLRELADQIDAQPAPQPAEVQPTKKAEGLRPWSQVPASERARLMNLFRAKRWREQKKGNEITLTYFLRLRGVDDAQ